MKDILYGVSAMAIGVGGKIIWDWLLNLKKPSIEELKMEMKLQQNVIELERRVTTLEADIKTTVSAEVFAIYVEEIKTIRETLENINKELHRGA